MAEPGLDRPRREPHGAGDRPTGDMNATDRSASDHAAHDLLLVAALADGDIEARDRSRAELQVTGCGECGELRDELVAIAAATTRLPRPTRSREFTISQDEAARLRRPSLRRFLIDLAGPRGIIGRPVATAVTSLGVAGILLASAGGMFGNGDAAGAATSETDGDVPRAAQQTAAPEAAPGLESGEPIRLGPSGAGASEPPQDTSGVAGASPDPGAAQVPDRAPTPAPSPGGSDLKAFYGGDSVGGESPLVPISIALLGLGLGLFVLRRIAARLA